MTGKKSRWLEEWSNHLCTTIDIIPWEASAETWRFTSVGPQAVKTLGYPIDQWYEQGFWVDHIHPSDRDSSIEFRIEATLALKDHEFEYRMIASNGRVVWLHDLVRVETVDEAPKMLRGFMIDITTRRMTDEALRTSEKRFRAVADATTDLIYIWNRESPILNWYGDIDRALGYGPLEFPRTKDTLMTHLHPDDCHRIKRAFAKCYREGKSTYVLEYRIQCKDGTYRDWLDRGTIFCGKTGKIIELVGACSDITELKRAQKESEALSMRLIQAQEEERRRISRELHDDISQRLALLTVGMERLSTEVPESRVGWARQLRELTGQVKELSTEVYRVSHRLHPAALEHLGLIPSARSLCNEISRSSNIQIDFDHSHIPGLIPQGVSLCIYRVLQESLNNIVRHSGARKAQVELTGHADAIRMSVSDSGVGFDTESFQSQAGLGLVSMRERVHQVQGELSIESRPSGGTRIKAWVPFTPAPR